MLLLKDRRLPEVPCRSMVPTMVWVSLAPKVKVLGEEVAFLVKLLKVVLPLTVWSPPFKITVPLLWVKVPPLWVKLPATFKVAGAEKMPPL